MRRITENYTIEDSAGGFVIKHELGRVTEFLGSDGLWHRRPQHCDSFRERHEAAQAIEREQGNQ